MNEGPLLESLLHRLSDCPSEFLRTCLSKNGAKQIAAILCDHFRVFTCKDDSPFVQSLLTVKAAKPLEQRHYGLMSIAIWLLHDDWFQCRPHLSELAWEWIQSDAIKQLSRMVSPEQFTLDPDRREELARNCLAAMSLRPYGETEEQANDRRTTLDSIERQKILAATAAAERRAREVREAMAKQKAMESASRYGE